MDGDSASTVLEPEPRLQSVASSDETPVTVTVVNYNGAEWIDECLDAVADLAGNVQEVIVVDNASTDDSVARIRRREPAVRLVTMDSNEGPCPARNRGLREAHTRWVLQIDSDVIVQSDTLERLLPQTKGPDVVVVMPRAVLASDRSVVHYDGGSMHYVGIMCLDRLLERVDEVAEPPSDVDAVISMALLVDRVAVLAVGAYDEAFFILFEDHDLSYRLRARGLRMRRVPAAVVLHREGTAGISYRPGASAYPGRRAYLHARNRPYLVLKNYSWPALVLSWPGRCVYALVWAVFALSRGVFLDYLKGRWDLLRLVPRALRLRGELAGRRTVPDRQLLGAADLTFSPIIQRRGLEARLERTLNGMLRAWWWAARRLLPAGNTTNR